MRHLRWGVIVFLTTAVLPVLSPGFSASGSAPAFAQGSGLVLTLHTDPHQGAFHILIPRGWKAEGGMVPSGVGWNIVDMVETNIGFRVTSPDGASFFGWYPRFYFQDPAIIAHSSGGYLNPQPGHVLNGCWVFPFLNVAQYVQTVVFGHLAAREFQNPRMLGPAVAAHELKPLVPAAANRADYGYVNFECAIRGTPSYGRIYSINYDLHGWIWSTVGTFGWVAPKTRWKTDERIMELCIRSFRIDSAWAQRAAAGSRQRAEKYHEVIREMNRIDGEISRNRSQTRSDIQEEVYKVLTWQIETFDPTTGRSQYLPLYNHAWTDGRGNYCLKDVDDGTLPVDNPTEWRRLKIVNRNRPDYRPLP